MENTKQMDASYIYYYLFGLQSALCDASSRWISLHPVTQMCL